MDFLASYVTDLVLYRSGDAMPCQLESPTQNQKEWKKVGISKTFWKKNKNKKTAETFLKANHRCVEAVFFFQMNLEYPGSIPNLNHEKQFSHFGTLWVAPGFGPPYPTDATQHHGGDRRPTVRPLEKGQLLVTSSVCFYEWGSLWWWDNRIQTLAAKKEHPGVSPKPCFSQINFCLNSECLELDVSQLTRPQRTFLTAGSGFHAEMIRYCYPNKTCFQWKVVWNYHYATVRSLLLAVSSPLFEQCSNAHPKRSKNFQAVNIFDIRGSSALLRGMVLFSMILINDGMRVCMRTSSKYSVASLRGGELEWA